MDEYLDADLQPDEGLRSRSGFSIASRRRRPPRDAQQGLTPATSTASSGCDPAVAARDRPVKIYSCEDPSVITLGGIPYLVQKKLGTGASAEVHQVELLIPRFTTLRRDTGGDWDGTQVGNTSFSRPAGAPGAPQRWTCQWRAVVSKRTEHEFR